MANLFPIVMNNAGNTAQLEVLKVGDNVDFLDSGIANLHVANFNLLDGSNGQVLTTYGNGTVYWGNGGGGNGIPAGSNREVQFNNDGVFGADPEFTYDKDTNTLIVIGNINAVDELQVGLVTGNSVLPELDDWGRMRMFSAQAVPETNVYSAYGFTFSYNDDLYEGLGPHLAITNEHQTWNQAVIVGDTLIGQEGVIFGVSVCDVPNSSPTTGQEANWIPAFYVTGVSTHLPIVEANTTGNVLYIDPSNQGKLYYGPISGGDGATGATGPAGNNGNDGATGATGIQGATGLTGATGAGSNIYVYQAPGTNIAPVVGLVFTGSGVLVSEPGASGVAYIDIPGGGGGIGATGATGIGAQGATGLTGATGETGATGIQGATGLTGATGIGVQGATGEKGATGADGATGLQGASGLQGATGETGATGLNFADTVYNKGFISGSVQFDRDDGTVQKATLTGSITLLTPTNVAVGQSITYILSQDGVGGHVMTPQGNYLFASGYKTLSAYPFAIDMLNIFYDGTYYYCTLTSGYS